MKEKKKKRTAYLLAGLVSAATFLVYLRTLANGFVNWDDDRYIYENVHLHSLSLSFVKWAFTSFYFSTWYPLTWISQALVYQVCGLDPVGYHLANVLLHAADTFIVVLLVLALSEAWASRALCADIGGTNTKKAFFPDEKDRLIAAVAAGLLFGLHPLHVESVAWAVERKDVLYAFFFLLSILVYVKYVTRDPGAVKSLPIPNSQSPIPGRRKPDRLYLLSLSLFALALMSKPMAVSLPLVLLILDWFPLGRVFSPRSLMNALKEKIPFIILSGCVSVLTLLSRNGKLATLKSVPLYERVLMAARAVAIYLWKMVLPLNLVPLYPYPGSVSVLSARYFFPLLLAAGITAFCLLRSRSNGLWLACWGYFIATLLPVIGIVQINGHWIADRYTYLPSLGPFTAAGVAAAWLWRKAGPAGEKPWPRWGKATAAALAVITVLGLSYLTFRQIGVWKNSSVFWDYIIQKEPGKIPQAYNNRGVFFMKEGHPGKALQDLDTVLAMRSSDADDRATAYYNIGDIYRKMGLLSLALGYYNRSISLSPDNSGAFVNRAIVFWQMGLPVRAESDLQEAITVNPEDCVAYSDLGTSYERQGQPSVAIPYFDRAARLDPGYSPAYTGRALAFEDLGQTGRALSDLKKACNMGQQSGCKALRALMASTASRPRE